jgi:epoxide hydrolase
MEENSAQRKAAGTALAEQTNNITHWTEFDRGGHCPAMEQPELLADDIRDFFL